MEAALARANAEAAELLAELEARSEELTRANATLAQVNVRAAELLAEVEEREEQLRDSNSCLAQANARSAELVAELQARREELEWANTNLKQANEDKKRILGIAAHDLRSGIAGILGLAEILEEMVPESAEDTREQAKMIRRESNRLLELLSNLLDESRAEMGKLQLRIGPTDLCAIATESVNFQRRAAEAKGQRIDLRLDRDIPAIEADGVRLRQVLDNLISNAVKYSPLASLISVEVAFNGDEIEVAVQDEGPGLTEDDLGKVFGEFARLSAKPTGGESSHGLGLAIVKRIVDLHRGEVWVENRKDRRGARFAFRIPSGNEACRTCDILVVDDAPVNRMILRRVLQRAGHRVDEVGGGDAAIAAWAAKPYDLVFMDVEMPDVDGLQATRCIRASGGAMAHVPIIALTGHTDPVSHSRCLESGMNEVLTKPPAADVLLRTVRRWVHARVDRAAA